jgi:molybdopterin molybdotransferase
MLTVSEAQERIVAALSPLGAEVVALDEACGRVLAQDLTARERVPRFSNSAMDGYALRAADAGLALSVAMTVPAGAPQVAPLPTGAAARIFTGAPIPAGADAVIMQEDALRDGDQVRFSVSPRPGAHIRRAGEDIEVGRRLLRAGAQLGPGDIGALASQRWSFVQVFRKPRVAIIPTGDEVRELDDALGPADIPNSNSHMLAAQVRAAGAEPVRIRSAADEPAALRQVLQCAAAGADLILSCGGVSVGDHDYLRDVVDTVDFWKVGLRPGKPLAFGRVGGSPVLGLPGNPVSAFVCFALFARPALRRLAGFCDAVPARVRASIQEAVAHSGDREWSLRATLEWQQGKPLLHLADRQGSGDISSLLGVNALAHIDRPCQAGDAVWATLL